AQWQRRGKLLISLVALFVVALLGAAAGVQQIQSRYVSLARATDQLRASQALVAERTEALESSEERFRRLFADSTDAILLIEGGVFVEGNAAALASLGLSDVADLRGLPPHRLSPDTQPDGEASEPKAVRMLATAAEQGSHTFEWVHRRLDGTAFWVEVVLTAISLRDRSLVYCMWRDITERKRAEASIRDALQLNERLLAAATVGIVVYERTGACPLANQAAADALGMSLESLLATPMADVPLWQAAGAVAAAQRALGSGAPQQFDARFEAAGGWRAELECSISVFERHEVPHLLFVVADVTERRLAEARRRQLSAIVEATSDFVGMATPDGRVTYLNSTARELLGLSADDDLSSFDLASSHPEWAARRVLEEGFPAALRGETWSARTAFLDRSGAAVPHSQVLIGHRGPSGEVEVISTVARDISAPVRSEQLTEARLRLMAAAATCVDTDAFLQTALDEMEAATGSTIGFYHFVEPDGEHLRLQAWSTNTVAHMCQAEGQGSHYPLSEAGIWADCARTGRAVVHNDYGSLTERRGLPAGHAAVTREVTVPVLRGGRAVAIIGVGNRDVPYDDAAVEMVQLLGDFSYEVVERLRAERDRAAGEERLRLVMSRVPCVLSTALVTARGEWRERALDPTPEGCPFDWQDVRVLNIDSAQALLPLEAADEQAYFTAWRLSRHPDDQRQANVNAGRALFDGASHYSNVWRCTDRFGLEHWQHQEVTIEAVDECTWRLFGVATDITDARRAELARVAGEELLREVTGGVPCILTTAVLEADPDWRQQVLDGTFSATTFRGSDRQVLNEEAAQGLLPLDVRPGQTYYDAWLQHRNQEDQERAGSLMLAAMLANHSSYVVEWRCTDRHGVEHWQRQEITMQPVGDARWRAFAVTIDITDRKRSETEQQALMTELKRSNAELEQFAYVASHDLQEPLRLVNAYTELLLQRYRDRLDDGAEPLVNFITDGVSRMQRLVQDLLLYSRVSSRNAPMLPTPMAAPLANALENLTLAIAESAAEFVVGELPVVPCDALQMTQLFQNLVGNAIKFRRADDVPRIQINARPTEDGAAWRFTVSDNGIGIEPEYHERIFVIFQRLHTRRQYPGTGIGLAVCKRIVERHGGEIGVESQPGEGTAFWFTLPIRAVVTDNGDGQGRPGNEGHRDTTG
ncbi:MAG: PAS domain S-box protein, partial [Armatimonadetes bacterium]|nr:PAS domain S-box protein [Armatimonadota bacterium]